MASRFDLYQCAKDAAYGSIRQMHDADGITWDYLNEWAGYKGPSSLKNVINQASHNLEFTRGAMLLKKASSVGNLRAHKHTIDTTRWEIVPRQDDMAATGSLQQELATAAKALGMADDAIKASNPLVLIEQYRSMQQVMAKLRAEIETLESRMKKIGE